jgi:hypothetical protein
MTTLGIHEDCDLCCELSDDMASLTSAHMPANADQVRNELAQHVEAEHGHALGE